MGERPASARFQHAFVEQKEPGTPKASPGFVVAYDLEGGKFSMPGPQDPTCSLERLSVMRS